MHWAAVSKTNQMLVFSASDILKKTFEQIQSQMDDAEGVTRAEILGLFSFQASFTL